MAYSESYPIDFRSGGDNVRDAFSKHIQEIAKIYGLLNDLERKIKQEVEALSTGTIDASRISGLSEFELQMFSGNLPMTRVSGNLDAHRVAGELTGATIKHEKVTGLGEYVKGLIDDSGGSAEDTTEGILDKNGYVKIGNGLIIQWGSVTVSTGGTLNAQIADANFAKAFPSECYGVIATLQSGYVSGDDIASARLTSVTRSNFTVRIYPANKSSAVVFYVAIGV